jgi:hypothetical protein
MGDDAGPNRASDIERLRLRIGSGFKDATAKHWYLLVALLIICGLLVMYISSS